MKIASLAIALFVSVSAQSATFPTWMTGSWQGHVNGVQMEEHWTSAAGGLMLGTHRDVRPNKKTFFEFLRIEEKDGKLTYLAMPAGQPPTSFPLKTLTSTKVVFENPEHDFPQRVIYWRDGKKLCAKVEGTLKGKPESEQWCWSRMK